MNQICSLITSRPILFLCLALSLASPFLVQLPQVKTVDNVDYFTVEGDQDVAFYETMKETFGDDEFFVIAFTSPNLFTAPVLRMTADITKELEELPEVREVQSLANVDYIHGAEEYFEVRPFLERIPDDQPGLDLLRNQALDNRMYVGNLISVDGKTTAMVVFPATHSSDDGGFRSRLLDKTKKVLKRHEGLIGQFHLAGWTVTNFSMSQYMKSDVATFIPLTYLFIAATIWLSFRNVRLTALAIVNISVCTGSTMGLFPLLGITLNNVTTIVPPLVMALALTDTVHIFAHLDRSLLDRHGNAAAALNEVLQKVVVPCFLTSLTTAVGFVSLVVSDIPPIKDFGYVASAGMIFEFVFSFGLLPPLLLLCKPEHIFIREHPGSGFSFNLFLARLFDFVSSRPRSICIVLGILSIGAIWSASTIKVETNLLEYFKKSSPLRQELKFVESRLSGVGTVDISLKANERDAFRNPVNLAVIERLQNHAETLAGVDRTLSFVDFIKDMNMSFHDQIPDYYRIPESRDMISQYLLLYDSDDIDEFITSAYDHARILIRISEHSSAGQARIITELRSFIESMAHDDLQIRVTGQAVKDVNIIDTLVQGQVESLTLAALLIAMIMFLALRSAVSGLLSLIPNLFPIALNFGIMGMLGITLNTSTALISVVALGIAVDDTIHFLTEYNRKKSINQNMRVVLHNVILEKGKGICSSTAILFISFSVLMLSRFVPTTNFGCLSAVIMLTAWIGDMIMLPAIMLSL